MASTQKQSTLQAKKNANNKLLAAEIGAGVLAAAAAGTAYYFYGTKNAKKHRHAASVWAKGMKKEVLKRAKKLKKLDQKAMAMIVDQTAAAYAKARSVKPEDLAHLSRELKANWQLVARELAPAAPKKGKKTKKAASKKRKTATKKTAKKAAPKAARSRKHSVKRRSR